LNKERLLGIIKLGRKQQYYAGSDFMKRLISILLSLIFIFSLSACHNNGVSTDTDTENQDSNEIGVEDRVNQNASKISITKVYDTYLDEIFPYSHSLPYNEKGLQSMGDYKIIKSFEEYEDYDPMASEKIKESLFDESFILAVVVWDYYNYTRFRKDDKIFADGKLTVDYAGYKEIVVSESNDNSAHLACVYLVIPKNIVYESTEEQGKIEITYNNLKDEGYNNMRFASNSINYEKANLQETPMYFFNTQEEIEAFWDETEANEDNLEDCISKEHTSNQLLLYYNTDRSTQVRIFKDFYIKDDTVYLIVENYVLYYSGFKNGIGDYSADHYANLNEFDIYLISIPNEKVNQALPQNPKFNITVIEYYN